MTSLTQQACNPKHNITVQASAGSGKTWLLISRLLHLLLKGAEPDSILAITFTRKAASEMQTRLLARLRELSLMDHDSLAHALDEIGITADNETRTIATRLYERLLRHPQQVTITTFHAFAQQLLRRFALEADIPAGFELIEKTALTETEAWDALFAEATRYPNDELAGHLDRLFKSCNGLHSTQTALKSFLHHRSDWWSYTQGQDNPVDFACQNLAEYFEIIPGEQPDFTNWLAQHSDACREYVALLMEHDIKKHSDIRDDIFTGLEDQQPGIATITHIKLGLATKQGSPRKLQSNPLLKKIGQDKYDRVFALQTILLTACNDIEDLIARQESYRDNIAWLNAGYRYLHHYQQVKLRQRQLDFTDLEWQACQLLNTAYHAHWIQYKMDQCINHFLVDEFQDTNPTQWRMLLPLLEELASGQAERERSVFLVGDAKQSIYSFRRADSQLFSYARGWLDEHLAAQQTPLNISWRSSPAIIDFVNHLFGDGVLGERLDDFTPHDTHQKSLPGRVEFLPMILREKEPLLEQAGLRNPLTTPRTDAARPYTHEAAQIAARIRTIIDNAEPIMDSGKQRPADYGDIMILLGRRTHIKDIEQALQHAGIPYSGSAPGTLLDTAELQDMLALLDTLNTPYDNLALARVLRSPLFSCSEDDLVALSCHGHRPSANWFSNLQAMHSTLSPALARARDLLSSWHELAGILPVHDLLDHIYKHGNVLTRFKQGFPAHLRHRVKANLLRFIELALEIDSGRYPSLAQFRSRLATWRNHDREGPDQASEQSTQSRVEIMTVHSAKGLEAPIVFIADAATTSTDRKGYATFVDWPSGDLSPHMLQLVPPSKGRDQKTLLALDKQAQHDQREDANLLYVAITRARQYLYISASEPRISNHGWYGLIKNRLDALELLDEQGQFTHTFTVKTEVESFKPVTSDQVAATLPAHLLSPSNRSTTDDSVTPSHDESLNNEKLDYNIAAQLRGSIIHRLLELLNSDDIDRDSAFDTLVSEFGDGPLADELINYRIEAEKVIDAKHNQPMFNAGCYQQAWNEMPISYVSASSKHVHGVIDRLVKYADHILIVDYKTDRELSPILRESYQRQLTLYIQGVEKLWPDIPVKACLLYTHSNQVINIENNR